MTATEDLLDLYHTVAELTGEMLDAARNGDWEQLSTLEARCSSHVATLKQRDFGNPLPPPLRERKLHLIKKILADDRAIRSITDPWMSHLSLMINSASVERKLSNLYGPGQVE